MKLAAQLHDQLQQQLSDKKILATVIGVELDFLVHFRFGVVCRMDHDSYLRVLFNDRLEAAAAPSERSFPVRTYKAIQAFGYTVTDGLEC